MDVIKVTLGSKKVVLLRPLQIKHQDLAAQAAAMKLGNQANDVAMALVMQKELLKLLLVQVDGADLKSHQLEDLDALFSVGEFTQLSQALNKLLEQQQMGNFQIEFATSGAT